MFKSDKWIIEQCEQNDLLTPFVKKSVKETEDGTRHVSHGPSSYGYDVTLAEEFKVFTNLFPTTEIDPLAFEEKVFEKVYATPTGAVSARSLDEMVEDMPEGFKATDVIMKTDQKTGNKYILIPPHSFVLGVTREYFKMPRDITGLVFNKSTYARCGLNTLTTVIEAGWEGQLVLEFHNTTSLPLRLYANQGIAQICFVQGDGECETSYADRGGKYQGQRGVQEPIC